MGLLVNGSWESDDSAKLSSTDGSFVRPVTQFRNWITQDGSSGFPAESGRYHLYVSHACPWAHRTLIMRRLKNLEEAISISVVDPLMEDAYGWRFSDYPGSIPDSVNNSEFLYQIYQQSNPTMTGRVSVPVLYDKKNKVIVNNESPEIIVMLNNCFEGEDFYPEELRSQIDEINGWVYEKINNGVYKAGFATSQTAYEEAVCELFKSLDRVEEILQNSRYLVGDRLTTADIRLFTTLVRFDPVYVGHFKCNIKRIVDYPNIWNYLKDVYQTKGFGDTVDMHHIKKHYYASHTWINPTRIIPYGPEINFLEPHDRELKFTRN